MAVTNHADERDSATESIAGTPADFQGTASPIGPYPSAWQLAQARPWLAAVALIFAAALGLTRGLTVPPQVMLAVFGWALCGWLALRPIERRPAPQRLSLLGALPWVAVLLAFAGLELYSFFRGSTYEHPTLSDITDPAFDTFGVRVAFVVGWLGAGWHLVRR